MTDRPIIFSAPMVRAMLAGRKTQTRRILRYQPTLMPTGMWHVYNAHGGYFCENAVEVGTAAIDYAPYAVGDRLYVRENWQSDVAHQASKPSCIPVGERIFFQAGGSINTTDLSMCAQGWRPCIHMPRWASRITLPVIDVRVQRLQDISEADATAEGAPCGFLDEDGKFYEATEGTYRAGFAGLWAHLHGADAWDVNPWIVAPTFTVEQCNIDARPK